MFTVARHLVIDDARSAHHRREIAVAETPDVATDDLTDALFESILIEEALASLSMDHRAVIVKAYYGGLAIAEIAAELDIPPGTVKSRLHYGLRALRLGLQEKGVTRLRIPSTRSSRTGMPPIFSGRSAPSIGGAMRRTCRTAMPAAT